MNKKGLFFHWIILFALISSLILVIFLLPKGEIIGKKSLAFNYLLTQEEYFNIFIKENAEQAARDSIKELALNGGFLDISPCGQFSKINLWNKKEQNCFPTDFKNDFSQLFNQKINNLIKHFPKRFSQGEYEILVKVPQIKYNLIFAGDSLSGLTSQRVELGLMEGDQYLASYYFTPSFSISFNPYFEDYLYLKNMAILLLQCNNFSCINETRKQNNLEFCFLPEDFNQTKQIAFCLTKIYDYQFALDFSED